MAAKDWDMMKDKAQQMTLTIRTVDGHAIRVTKNAAELLEQLEHARPGIFYEFRQDKLTHWIKPMHVSSITISRG